MRAGLLEPPQRAQKANWWLNRYREARAAWDARGSNILNRNAVRRLSAEKDALLAALPHALRSCGCELKPAKFVARQSMLSGGTMRMRWPEEHEAAIEWLRGRCP